MKKSLKDSSDYWLVVCLAVLGVLIPSYCLGSGYEFEGVGARQVARGGAAIADSDDWTSIYWNPAGLALAARKGNKEIGAYLFGGILYGRDSNSLSNLNPPGAIFSKETISSHFIIGGAGAVIPLSPKLGIGCGYYMPLLQGVDFEESVPALGVSLKYKGSAGIMVWNISAGYEFFPKLAAGAGFNLMYGRLTNEAVLVIPIPVPDTLASDMSGHGFGLEAVFGVRYDPTSTFSVGAVFRSGSHISIEGDSTASSQVLPDESSRFKFRFDHPPTSGIGLAWRPNKRLTMTFDFTQTYWSGFENTLSYERPGTLIKNRDNTFNWRNTYKLHLGTIVKAGKKTELLGGYTFDRHALDAGSIDISTTIDASVHRLYAGLSHQWSSHFATILGGVVGTGRRTESPLHYRLSGWQVMSGARFGF